MRRLTALILALMLSLAPLSALAEDHDTVIETLTGLVQRALERYNSLTYEENDGEPYFSLVFESNNGRMGDLYAYVDVYYYGILMHTCYDSVVPEDRMDEIVSFINLVNADLFGGKYYLRSDTGDIYYEYYLMMDFTDLNSLDKDSEETLYEIFSDMTVEADYNAEYFAEIIGGVSAKHAYAMYLADLELGW
ncbi:MAG: YbjN domain-containing protein [Christensenellaceae bacterium]|nr:YbjN domain-containing protein [Christensenellaceae bacterium]